MDGAQQKKPTGDDSVLKEMMQNKEAAMKEVMDRVRSAAEEAKYDYRKKIAIATLSIFLGGAVTGAVVYGFFRSRSDSYQHSDE